MRIPCGRASRGQAQAAAPLQRNSAKFVMKSTARHQSIGTGDKPIHSVERAALRPGIALIKGKLSCFFFCRKNNEDWKGPVLISHWYHYTSRLLRETRWCVYLSLQRRTTTSDPSQRVSLGDTLCSCQKNPQKTSPWRKPGEDLSKDDSNIQS